MSGKAKHFTQLVGSIFIEYIQDNGYGIRINIFFIILHMETMFDLFKEKPQELFTLSRFENPEHLRISLK
jgi:hypothetical protein